MPDLEAAYQVSKVARILRISRPLTLRLIRSGEIPSSRTPLGLRVDANSLIQWVEERISNAWLDEAPLAKAGLKRVR